MFKDLRLLRHGFDGRQVMEVIQEVTKERSASGLCNNDNGFSTRQLLQLHKILYFLPDYQEKIMQ